jgi:type IV fimbrial biogenesis protein FimT
MPSKTQSGVTLIELLIGIALISLLLGIGVPSFRVWMQNTQVRNAADALLNGLQLARAEALRRNMNVEFAMGSAADWTVWQQNPRTRLQDYSGEEGQTKKAQIGATPGDASIVTFSPLGGVITNQDGSSTLQSIDIQTPIATPGVRRLRIEISTSGSARLCDWTPDQPLPAGDPRVCK